MALLDKDTNAVVVRIVYAGAPMAGKTATVRSLAAMLFGNRGERAVFSPEEAHGRTLHFDWVDYVGGSFRGRRVRCQIIAVPGQDALADRRRWILELADAVVFVVDSQPQQIEAAARYFEEMAPSLERGPGEPPVGVIVQANKRDLPDAVAVDDIKQQLGDNPNLGVIATTATLGKGVREAFVMSVGLALERVGALLDANRLAVGKPEIDNGEDLLALINAKEMAAQAQWWKQAAEQADGARAEETADKPAVAELPHILSSAAVEQARREEYLGSAPAGGEPQARGDLDESGHAPTAAEPVPRLPDVQLTAGAIWPPVAGRIALHEMTDKPTAMARQADGSWVAQAGRWRLVSATDQVFQNMEEGRKGLLAYARRYKSIEALLSNHRCMALAPDAGNQWRLWEIVRAERTLADILKEALSDRNPIALATQVLRVANNLLHVTEAFSSSPLPLRARPETVALIAGKPVYIDLLPAPNSAVNEPVFQGVQDIAAFIRTHFALPIAAAINGKLVNVSAVLRWLKRKQGANPKDRVVIETLSALFIGH
ncbi:MAG: GTPase domain-containing protein [Gammaproteobacteria bacterium]